MLMALVLVWIFKHTLERHVYFPERLREETVAFKEGRVQISRIKNGKRIILYTPKKTWA